MIYGKKILQDRDHLDFSRQQLELGSKYCVLCSSLQLKQLPRSSMQLLPTGNHYRVIKLAPFRRRLETIVSIETADREAEVRMEKCGCLEYPCASYFTDTE